MIRTKRAYSERAMELVNTKRAGVHRMTLRKPWRYDSHRGRSKLMRIGIAAELGGSCLEDKLTKALRESTPTLERVIERIGDNTP